MSHKKSEYPKYLYSKTEDTKLVHTPEEHEALGKGWHEEPHAPLKGDNGSDLNYATAQPEADATVKHGADEKKGGNVKHGLK